MAHTNPVSNLTRSIHVVYSLLLGIQLSCSGKNEIQFVLEDVLKRRLRRARGGATACRCLRASFVDLGNFPRRRAIPRHHLGKIFNFRKSQQYLRIIIFDTASLHIIFEESSDSQPSRIGKLRCGPNKSWTISIHASKPNTKINNRALLDE